MASDGRTDDYARCNQEGITSHSERTEIIVQEIDNLAFSSEGGDPKSPDRVPSIHPLPCLKDDTTISLSMAACPGNEPDANLNSLGEQSSVISHVHARDVDHRAAAIAVGELSDSRTCADEKEQNSFKRKVIKSSKSEADLSTTFPRSHMLDSGFQPASESSMIVDIDSTGSALNSLSNTKTRGRSSRVEETRFMEVVEQAIGKDHLLKDLHPYGRTTLQLDAILYHKRITSDIHYDNSSIVCWMIAVMMLAGISAMIILLAETSESVVTIDAPTVNNKTL